ncbi:hypothetical protein [Pseudomonas caricapapayae]|uniref:hypothetical protein n=1 Tax=Pseudomonas caricapapayae TaxID=46678 RepID=UPI0011C3AB56|nr:hypothetical protein [Pseudomonas caricapapayae]
MEGSKLIFGLLGIVILSSMAGCGNNQVSYGNQCMTCFDNPVTGKPMNYDPAAHSNKVVSTSSGLDPAMRSSSTSRPIGRDEIQLNYANDVDSVAMRLKAAFDYQTRDEAIAQSGNVGKTMFDSPAYAYSGNSGSYYFMKQPYAQGIISTTVAKQGSGARVVFTYDQMQAGGSDAQSVMKRIKAKAEAALR